MTIQFRRILSITANKDVQPWGAPRLIPMLRSAVTGVAEEHRSLFHALLKFRWEAGQTFGLKSQRRQSPERERDVCPHRWPLRPHPRRHTIQKVLDKFSPGPIGAQMK